MHLIFHFGLLCAAFITFATDDTTLRSRGKARSNPWPVLLSLPLGYIYTGRRSQDTSSARCNFPFYCQVVSDARHKVEGSEGSSFAHVTQMFVELRFKGATNFAICHQSVRETFSTHVAYTQCGTVSTLNH